MKSFQHPRSCLRQGLVLCEVRLEYSGNSQGTTSPPPCKKLLERCEEKNGWTPKCEGKKHLKVFILSNRKEILHQPWRNSILRRAGVWKWLQTRIVGTGTFWVSPACDRENQSSPLILRACVDVETTSRTSFSSQIENSNSNHALCQGDLPEIGSHLGIFQAYSNYCWGAIWGFCWFNILCYCTFLVLSPLGMENESAET